MSNRSQSGKPALEHELLRDPKMGFEPVGASVVRCLEHGAPWPLERWHFHDEYELQLITKTHGRAFVGDYIGHYSPGYLALTAPRLPHNWISTDQSSGDMAARNLVVHFMDTELRQGMKIFPELSEVGPLLDRARHGVEFFGMSERVHNRFYRIKGSQGLERLIEFTSLLNDLARCDDYRLLSTVQMECSEGQGSMTRINKVLDYLNENYAEEFSIGDVCALVGMAEASFSRYFRRTTGNTLTDFVTRLRVAKACQLLEQSDNYVSGVCYEVGFRNIANFNRRFLEIKGVTPTQYRRQATTRSGRGLDSPSQ
jgi:AraC-like DNA-binding protein